VGDERVVGGVAAGHRDPQVFTVPDAFAVRRVDPPPPDLGPGHPDGLDGFTPPQANASRGTCAPTRQEAAPNHGN